MEQPPSIEEKVWGQVRHLLFSPKVAISHLTIKKNTFCSVHRHLQRVNHFFLLSGSVRILLYGEGPEPLVVPSAVLVLPINRAYHVPARVWHQFQVDVDGEMVEVYTPDPVDAVVSFEDIDRFSLGGVRA